MDLKPYRKCPECRSSNLEVIHLYPQDGMEVLKCKDCGKICLYDKEDFSNKYAEKIVRGVSEK